VYAIEKTLQEHAYSLLITNNRPVSSIRSLVYEKRVDGLIIPPASLDEETVQFLAEEHFPFVVLGEPAIGQTRMTWVDVDNRKGSREAVAHLCRQGFRRIVMIVRNDRTVFARNRILGYQDGVTEICPPQVICVEEPDGQQRPPEQADAEFWTDGQAAKLEELAVRLVGGQKADAFLCADNEIAYHVLRALHGAGIRIPGEAGVVTFDNYPLAPFMDPPLTAVDVDTSRLGKAAAELLIQSIHEEDRPPRQVLIGTSLIRRMSSAGKEGQ
jgi:DNA-binding LacI/PurR family transcriptional regulator